MCSIYPTCTAYSRDGEWVFESDRSLIEIAPTEAKCLTISFAKLGFSWRLFFLFFLQNTFCNVEVFKLLDMFVENYFWKNERRNHHDFNSKNVFGKRPRFILGSGERNMQSMNPHESLLVPRKGKILLSSDSRQKTSILRPLLKFDVIQKSALKVLYTVFLYLQSKRKKKTVC